MKVTSVYLSLYKRSAFQYSSLLRESLFVLHEISRHDISDNYEGELAQWHSSLKLKFHPH
jgi:hypothetical protein